MLLLILCLVPEKALQAQTATIEGAVVLESNQNVTVSSNMGGYQSSTPGDMFGQTDSSSNNIIIWLEDKDQNVSYEDQDRDIQVLDQVNKRFKPRLMVIRAGDFVRIQNSDPVYHNVFSLSKTRRFDVGRRSPEEYDDVRFDKAGIVDVFCDIHSDMHAVIVVVPKQTVVWQKLEESGTFRFENIPQGNYTLHFYALGNRRTKVDVQAADVEKMTLETIRLGS